MNNNNPVLIIGGKGFIGSVVARTLDDNSVPYYLIGRDECDLLNYLDTENYLKVFRRKSVHIIFTASIKRTKDDSSAAMQKNIEIIRNFIKASRDLNTISLVFLSSIDVYAQENNSPLTEESGLFSNNFYAISKICSEYMLQSAFSSSVLTILRLPGIYGKGDNHESVIGQFANSITNSKKIILSNEGNQSRDYVLVDDIGEIILHLIQKPTPGIFNVSTGESLKIISIVKLISEILGKKVNLYKAVSDIADNNLIISNNKLSELIPSVSFTPMDSGIKKYIQEHFLDE